MLNWYVFFGYFFFKFFCLIGIYLFEFLYYVKISGCMLYVIYVMKDKMR